MPIECVKCGLPRQENVEACPTCTWPFTVEAWQKTTYHIHRITLDTGCVNSKRKNASLNKLEEWSSQGHLQLQRAEEMLNELARPGGERYVEKALALEEHPPVFMLGSSVLDGGHVLAGPDWWFQIKNILFHHPLIDHGQNSDIQHLRQHVLTGGDAFVTFNVRDYIKHGKQEKLRHLGIWSFHPDALVEFLSKLYSWS